MPDDDPTIRPHNASRGETFPGFLDAEYPVWIIPALVLLLLAVGALYRLLA